MLAVGFRVLRFKHINFQNGRFAKAAPAGVFRVNYTANAAGSTIDLTPPQAPDRFRFIFTAPNNGVVQVIDRFVHFDANIPLTRVVDMNNDVLYEAETGEDCLSCLWPDLDEMTPVPTPSPTP